MRLTTLLCPVNILVLFIGISLLVSLPSYAQNSSQKESLQERIRDLQKEYEDSKRELDEGKKVLKEKETQKLDVQKKLNTAEKNITVLNNTLISIKNKERRIGSEIETTQDVLLKTENNLKQRSDEYAASLRAMYKRRRMSALELLFTQGSFSAIMRGIKMFETISREDMRIMDEIRTSQNTIESSMKSLKAARNTQLELAKQKKRDQELLEKTILDRRKLLTDIKRDEEHQKVLILERQAEMEKIYAEIENLQKRIASEVNNKHFLDEISDDVRTYNFASKKGLLPWPAEGRVISQFGLVTDPTTKTQTHNRGIEIETRQGVPIHAIGSGIVMRTISLRGYGNLVWIYHPPNHYTIYAHLSDILVNPGSEVREGDIIGLAGSTGLIDDSKSCLLIEILNGRTPENPLSWLKADPRRSGSL